MRTSIIRWSIALLLLVLVTSNLLAQPVPPRLPEDTYPPPPTIEPYPGPTRNPYPWPTEPQEPYPPSPVIPTRTPRATPSLATLSVSEDLRPRLMVGPKPNQAKRRAAAVVELAPVVFVPSAEDIAIARQQAELARTRLLSDTGWWK